jgi:hypothetical protein
MSSDMHRPRLDRRRVSALALPVLLAVAGACNFSDDAVDFSQLERLRVLGIRSEPADVAPGETAHLNALVFEPEGRDVRYAWSWCPARGDAEESFRCLIEESELQALWQATGSSEALPPYDLGSGETAELPMVFDEGLLEMLCAALFAQGTAEDSLLLACLSGLEPSIRLTVATDEEELVALKTLPLADADAPAARNQNPELNGEIELRQDTDGRVLDPDEPLRADTRYWVRVGVDPEQAETFQPEPDWDEPEPRERREALSISWFVTSGRTYSEDRPRRGPGGDTNQDTSFLDGVNEFDDLLEGGWQLPATLDTRQGRLFLVLRDERGGVGWAEHRFTLQGDE